MRWTQGKKCRRAGTRAAKPTSENPSDLHSCESTLKAESSGRQQRPRPSKGVGTGGKGQAMTPGRGARSSSHGKGWSSVEGEGGRNPPLFTQDGPSLKPFARVAAGGRGCRPGWELATSETKKPCLKKRNSYWRGKDEKTTVGG